MNKINTYLTKLIRFFSDCGRILTQNLQYPKLVIKDISECPAILFDIDEERKYRTDTKQRWPVLRITIIKYMKYRLAYGHLSLIFRTIPMGCTFQLSSDTAM